MHLFIVDIEFDLKKSREKELIVQWNTFVYFDVQSERSIFQVL